MEFWNARTYDKKHPTPKLKSVWKEASIQRVGWINYTKINNNKKGARFFNNDNVKMLTAPSARRLSLLIEGGYYNDNNNNNRVGIQLG